MHHFACWEIFFPELKFFCTELHARWKMAIWRQLPPLSYIHNFVKSKSLFQVICDFARWPKAREILSEEQKTPNVLMLQHKIKQKHHILIVLKAKNSGNMLKWNHSESNHVSQVWSFWHTTEWINFKFLHLLYIIHSETYTRKIKWMWRITHVGWH